jgi:DNA ligase-1
MQHVFDNLYKRDRNGGVRVWYLEQDGGKYRTHSGLVAGKLSVTGWTHCEAKNVGKKNETNPVTQATQEIDNEYAKKLDRGYFRSIDDIDNPVPIKPMLAQKYQDLVGKKSFKGFDFANDVWYAQPKLDGIRNIATKHGQFSRTGQPTTGAPHVFEELAAWFTIDPTVIFDGELYNHELKDDFNAISSNVRKKKHTPETLAASRELVQYHIYDVIIEGLTFEERQALLDDFFADYQGSILVRVESILITSQQQLDQCEALWVGDGYEGQMVRSNGEYENTRSWNLLKRKTFDDAEFEFVRVEEGNGNWAGMAKRVIFIDPKKPGDDKEQASGMRGSQEFAIELLEGGAEGVTHVTVRYFGRTPDGVMRMPVTTDFHYGDRKD